MTVNLTDELDRARRLADELRTGKASWRFSGTEWDAWKDRVLTLIRRVYGQASQQEKDFTERQYYGTYTYYDRPDPGYEARTQRAFVETLDKLEGFMKALVEDIEARLPHAAEDRRGRSPRVFIAHGGESSALVKLEDFLMTLGCDPIIAEKQPSEGRSVDEQVEWCLDQADCAIVLATAEDLKEGKVYSRPNVYIELGRFQERFPERTVYLLESGARFPSNVSEKVWELFTQDNMERAYLKLVRELSTFGFLRAQVIEVQ